MRILLTTTGSAGDVYPFIALGRALSARGHEIVMIAPLYFQSLIQHYGFKFVPLEPKVEVKPVCSVLHQFLDSVLRNCTRRWRKLGRASTIVPHLRPTYQAIAEHTIPGRTVVVAAAPMLGARLAHDRLNVPLVTVHFSPSTLRSVEQPPLQPPFCLPNFLPHRMRRAAYRLLDRLVLDPLLAGSVNRLRDELHLPSVRRVLHKWRNSPQLVLGLFPSWFAPPASDWPSTVQLTGFLFHDEEPDAEASPELHAFLDQGNPPILLTPGSAVRHVHRFFEEGIRACTRAGYRALLVTRFREQIPASLPEGMRHCEYVPFSQVLPRVAALVHTGGIGTAAQAMAAGIPQLIMPLKNDQPDNARRLEQLGVSQTLNTGSFWAPRIAYTLAGLLNDSQVAWNCRLYAQRLQKTNALAASCRLIEQVVTTSLVRDA